MTYSTKTRSNTPPGRYHVRQTLSHWKNRQKTNRRPKTEAKPCHALSSSEMTPAYAIGGVNHGPMPKLGSWLCCRLQLSWLPVNHSSEGDTQSCCIVIAAVIVGIAWKKCNEDTAPTSWSIIDSCTQLLGPCHGLCCRCRNWRRFSVAMWTSARQMKRKMVVSICEGVSESVSNLETLLHSCNWNWRRFSEGRSSSACPKKLIPVDCGSPYSAYRVEEGLSSLKV